MIERKAIKEIVAKFFSLKSSKEFSARLFDIFIEILVLLNVAAVILESYENIYQQFSFYFEAFEIFTVTVFTIEYLLRLWVSDLNYPRKLKWQAYKKFIFSANSLVDLISILPFFIPIIANIDLRHLRIFRLIRLLRVFKLTKYSHSLTVIGKIMSEKKQELLATLLMFFSVLVMSSSIMYYLENEAQPNAFPNIMQSFWWGIITLTTIGYGDIYPITALGKILGGLIAMMGVMIVAIPTGIISSSFVQKMEEGKQKRRMSDIRSKLREAFYKKYVPEIACKVRRGQLSLEAVKVNLELSEDDIYKIAEGKNEFRFRIMKIMNNGVLSDKLFLEYRETNTEYGTLTERKGKIIVVSPESLNKQGIGYFAYCLSEKLKSSYISNEFYGDEAIPTEECFGDKGLELENAFNFRHNKAYFQKTEEEIPDGFFLWQEHLQKLNQPKALFLVFNTFDANNGSFVHLTYFKKRNSETQLDEFTFQNHEKLNDFKTTLISKATEKYKKTIQVTDNGNFQSIRENNIIQYISENLLAEAILININKEYVMKENLFVLVGLMADAIKEELIGY